MTTSLWVDKINELLDRNRSLASVSSSPTCIYLLNMVRDNPDISIERIEALLEFKAGTAKEWLARIQQTGLIECTKGRYALSIEGKKKLALTDSTLEVLGGTEIPGDGELPNKLPDSYFLDSTPLGAGATSVTFRAIQGSTGLPRTVKIFRPGLFTYEDLEAFRNKRKSIAKDVAIPDFIGMGLFRRALKPEHDEMTLACQVFDYVNENAKTLEEFLTAERTRSLSRDFFKYFVEHVGGALEAINKSGLQHGDLHRRNILVISKGNRLPEISFKVIDLAGGSSFNSVSFSGVTDLEMFKRHLIWCLSEVCRHRPGISASELVGYAVQRVISGLRENQYTSFTDLLSDFHKPVINLPAGYFREPSLRPFQWLRVEMMPLRELYMLFEPDDYAFGVISGHDNVVISGPRGCGKSHYLRILSFSPELLQQASTNESLSKKLKKLEYDVHRFFGILFECRIGEFKMFTPEALGVEVFDLEVLQFLKHLLILKIINKTMSLLREAFAQSTITVPQSLTALRSFLGSRYPDLAIYGESGVESEIGQITRYLVTKEKHAEATWRSPADYGNDLLKEPDLDGFFESLQHDFPDLARTRFYILVDDISEGRMHPEMQRVVNSIMTSATRRYCFKVTCDKFMYTLDTVEGRTIDPFQDVVYVDLGDLSVKAQRRRKVLREYLQNIVNARLNAWAGNELDIADLLGESQKPEEFLIFLSRPKKSLNVRSHIGRRSDRQDRALYAGWNIAWQLAHGSVRTFFQMLDYLFTSSKFNPKKPSRISSQIQDKCTREFSTRKFQSLLMLTGEAGGKPLGTPISNIARSIGEISRLYLTRWKTGEMGRFYETISLERLDQTDLSPDAGKLLKYLIVYDVLMIEGITFSRAQIGRSERYDLNKIYSPCFEVTYRVRNHLYLSRRKLEKLLLQPDHFVRKVRAHLESLTKTRETDQTSLFDREPDDYGPA